MSVFGFHSGSPRTEQGIISGTSAVTILDTASDLPNQEGTVIGIVMTNLSNGALAPVVDVYDGTTAYVLRDDANLADKATEEIVLPGGFYKLVRGDSVRITANTGLHWHISFIEPNANAGGA